MNEIRNHPLQHPYFAQKEFGTLSDLKQIFTEDEIDMLIGCGFITIHSSTCANDTNKDEKTIISFIKGLWR